MSVHLNLDGSWAECVDEQACPLLYHLPELTMAEAEALPMHLLYPLLSVVSPPSLVQDGKQLWMGLDGMIHREYDLPAIIYPEGHYAWYRHNRFWRADGKPQVVRADGELRWYDERGSYHREGGPAVILADGSEFWWHHGKQHRRNGPAVTHADGRKETWVNGFKFE